MDTKNNDEVEITEYGVVLTADMSRDMKEYHRYPEWGDNPKILWNQPTTDFKRCEIELNIYCKAYEKDIKDYQDLLYGDKEIRPRKHKVLEYRKIYHPVMLQKSRELAVCMIMGWIRKNVNDSLFPPDAVILVIKMFVLEDDCHFRITYWNPYEVIVNQKYWGENETFTDEETEMEAYELLEQNKQKE